jgi:hypothetical protein
MNMHPGLSWILMNELMTRESEVGKADYGSHGFSFRVEMQRSQVYNTGYALEINQHEGKKYHGRQIRQSAAGSKILKQPIMIRER